MKTYIVSYDLNQPGQDYKTLIGAIKNYSDWCHPLESTWVVKSDSESKTIRDQLGQHIDSTDQLFVAELTGQAAWRNLSDEDSSWLKKNL